MTAAADSRLLALSVRQPWASMIASGAKTIEVRSWSTRHRGDLAIVAGLRADRSVDRSDLPRGVIVAMVQLVDVRPLCESDLVMTCAAQEVRDWILAGRKLFAWVLRDVHQVSSARRERGRLGLFEIDALS